MSIVADLARLPAAIGIGSLRTERSWQAVAAILAAGAIASAAVGGSPALVVFVAGIFLVAAAGRLAGGPADGRRLTQLLLGVLGGRAVLAAVIHLVLLTRNTRGNMFSDDAGYAIAANALAQLWRGGPISELDYSVVHDPSIASAYTTMLGGVLLLVGHSWLALKLVNVALGVVQGALVFRTMRNLGLPGAWLAATAVLLFPSLVLWSTLVLKDTAALTALLVAVWGVSEFQRSGRLIWWIPTILAFLWLRDVRLYVFLLASVSWPLTILVVQRRHRWRMATAAAVVAAGMVLTSPGTSYFDPKILSSIAYVRSVMAENARSAYVEPLTVYLCAPDDVHVIDVLGRTPDPAIPPRRIEVRSGVQLVPEGAAAPSVAPGTTARPLVHVRPNDVVVCVGDATPAPAPAAADASLVYRCAPDDIHVVEVPGRTPDPAVPPRRIEVRSGVRLVPEGAPRPSALPGQEPQELVHVRPGDTVVCIGAPVALVGAAPGLELPEERIPPRPGPLGPSAASTSTPLPGPVAPAPTPRRIIVGFEPTPSPAPVAARAAPPPPLRVQSDRANVISTPRPKSALPGPESLTFVSGVEANIKHLPLGVLFLVAAPFPLTAATVTERALIPEMLLWYASVALGLYGLWLLVTSRNARPLFAVLMLGGIGLILSLAEGNVGTLVRHRAMLIPLAVMLAATGAVAFEPRLRRVLGRSRRS